MLNASHLHVACEIEQAVNTRPKEACHVRMDGGMGRMAHYGPNWIGLSA